MLVEMLVEMLVDRERKRGRRTIGMVGATSKKKDSMHASFWRHRWLRGRCWKEGVDFSVIYPCWVPGLGVLDSGTSRYY